MMKRRSRALDCRTKTPVVALGIALSCSAPAFAQATADTATQTPPPGNTLGDIVVTARKVAENLQRVPIAVTAYSGAELRQQGAVQISDIAKLTPGLVITPAAIGAGAAQFTIRGQVQQDNLATLDPSVGTYVDGVYWARAYGINSNLLDVHDVQPLKGPQGTLFGRNTPGGALLIQTNDPNFADGYAFHGSMTYGRFNQLSGNTAVNLPLVDDKLAVRVAYDRDTRDGYITDTTSGRKLDARNNYTIRGKVLYKATNNLRFLLSAETYHTNSLTNPFRADYLAPGGLANTDAQIDIAKGAPGPSQTIVAQNADTDHISIGILPHTYVKTQTYDGTVTLDTSFGAIKGIFGYRKIQTEQDVDLDGSPYDILGLSSRQGIHQYSGELQITGKALDNALEFAGGVYYFHEAGYDASYSSSLGALNPTLLSLAAKIDNDSQGLYGQTTYHATNRLSITGGVRYSIDDKRATTDNGIYTAGIYSGPLPGATFICKLPTCPYEQHASFGGISYTGSIDYAISDQTLAYAKTAKSFRGGGENARGSSFFSGSEDAFKPETATSYEAGIKNELFDHKLRVNLAGYYTIDKNIQRTTVFADAMGNTATVVTNAGRADFYGGELEVNALLPAGFRIDATAAYTHPEYKKYIDPTTGFDRSHERFYGIAKWTASMSPSWTHDFGPGKFGLRGDFIYQSSTPLYDFNYYVDGGTIRDASTGAALTAQTANALLTGSTDKAHMLVNARANITVLDGKLDLAVWGRNLTDKRDRVAAYPFSSLGAVFAMRREPRTVGITATINLSHL